MKGLSQMKWKRWKKHKDDQSSIGLFPKLSFKLITVPQKVKLKCLIALGRIKENIFFFNKLRSA